MMPGLHTTSDSKRPSHGFEFIRTFWPIVAMFATALIGYGALRADVAQLKDGQVAAKQDHDAIVRIESEQKQMSRDVDTIKRDVKAIAEAVQPR